MIYSQIFSYLEAAITAYDELKISLENEFPDVEIFDSPFYLDFINGVESDTYEYYLVKADFMYNEDFIFEMALKKKKTLAKKITAKYKSENKKLDRELKKLMEFRNSELLKYNKIIKNNRELINEIKNNENKKNEIIEEINFLNDLINKIKKQINKKNKQKKENQINKIQENIKNLKFILDSAYFFDELIEEINKKISDILERKNELQKQAIESEFVSIQLEIIPI